MKSLILSYSLEGGAGGAAYRLHQGLRRIGVTSQVLVVKKEGDDHTVIPLVETTINRGFSVLREKLNNLPLRLYPNNAGYFSTQWPRDSVPAKVAQLNPDIINLHWILNGFVQIESLRKFDQPLVFTLHDMWAFTGGCVHSLDCDRYTNECGSCPQLGSTKSRDLSRWVWGRKARAWKNLDLTVVTPSNWLAESARSSSLFKDKRVEVVPNGLDVETYRPVDRRLARQLLGLPLDKKIILFGAWSLSHWKGFHLLQGALQSLSMSGWHDKLELVLFGFSEPEEPIDLGIKAHYLGRLYDDISLALVYSAADVKVVPSLVESFGLTACESLACGTPVVAFNVSGLRDIIDHKQNGYLATPFEIEDLAQGIVWILEDDDRRNRLSKRAREKVEKEFTLELQAQRYLNLYSEALENHKRANYAKNGDVR